MRATAMLVGLLIALGVGYFYYRSSLTGGGAAAMPPQEQIDVTSIRSGLLVIGQAERQYVVAHGAYATLEELQQEGGPSIVAEDRGYTFAVAPNGAQSFTATATPTDPAKAGWPTLTIDETMQVKQQ